MEKRDKSRLKARYFVKINDKTGVVNDISHNGMNISVPFLPTKRKVDITINTDNETIEMRGIIMWAKRKITYGEKNILGITIPKPPESYLKLISESEN